MAREIGWLETKIRFFAVESTQNDQNDICNNIKRHVGLVNSSLTMLLIIFLSQYPLKWL